MKPGSCGLPYFGIQFAIVDPVVRRERLYTVTVHMRIVELPYDMSACATSICV